mmetsp:Transcript_34693/g.112862  ORF Transcript_34693/g.112862 Transcript_34693/m.112862 type:complete len:232 (+) Transcript_34693:1607-2302(+)
MAAAPETALVLVLASTVIVFRIGTAVRAFHVLVGVRPDGASRGRRADESRPGPVDGLVADTSGGDAGPSAPIAYHAHWDAGQALDKSPFLENSSRCHDRAVVDRRTPADVLPSQDHVFLHVRHRCEVVWSVHTRHVPYLDEIPTRNLSGNRGREGDLGTEHTHGEYPHEIRANRQVPTASSVRAAQEGLVRKLLDQPMLQVEGRVDRMRPLSVAPNQSPLQDDGDESVHDL